MLGRQGPLSCSRRPLPPSLLPQLVRPMTRRHAIALLRLIASTPPRPPTWSTSELMPPLPTQCPRVKLPFSAHRPPSWRPAAAQGHDSALCAPAMLNMTHHSTPTPTALLASGTSHSAGLAHQPSNKSGTPHQPTMVLPDPRPLATATPGTPAKAAGTACAMARASAAVWQVCH